MSNKISIGNVFSRLVVIEKCPNPSPSSNIRALFWKCKCQCGNYVIARSAMLTNGRTKSCGCGRRDRMKNNIKHGMARADESSRPFRDEYRTWLAMRARCGNPAYPNYLNIKVCKEWDDFETFINDMGPRPSSRHSIDRINNLDGYSKENCRWVTMKEQSLNKRSNVIIEYMGEAHPLIVWSRRFGIHYETCRGRIARGLPLDKVFFKGVLKKK